MTYLTSLRVSPALSGVSPSVSSSGTKSLGKSTGRSQEENPKGIYCSVQHAEIGFCTHSPSVAAHCGLTQGSRRGSLRSRAKAKRGNEVIALAGNRLQERVYTAPVDTCSSDGFEECTARPPSFSFHNGKVLPRIFLDNSEDRIGECESEDHAHSNGHSSLGSPTDAILLGVEPKYGASSSMPVRRPVVVPAGDDEVPNDRELVREWIQNAIRQHDEVREKEFEMKHGAWGRVSRSVSEDGARFPGLLVEEMARASELHRSAESGSGTQSVHICEPLVRVDPAAAGRSRVEGVVVEKHAEGGKRRLRAKPVHELKDGEIQWESVHQNRGSIRGHKFSSNGGLTESMTDAGSHGASAEGKAEPAMGNKGFAKELVKDLKDLGEVRDVDRLLDDRGVLPMGVFSMVFQQLGAMRRVDTALAVLDWMRLRGPEATRPNVFTYNAMLGVLKVCKRWGDVHNVLWMMEKAKIAPDTVTYNTLIGIFERQGLVEAALWLLKDMRWTGAEPTLFTYKGLIKACLRVKRVMQALQFFVKAKSVQMVLPSEAEQLKQLATTVTAACEIELRRLAFHEGSVEEAAVLADAMLTAELRPNPKLLAELLSASCRSHVIEGSLVGRMYKALRSAGEVPDVRLCNKVMMVLGRSKLWWTSLSIYESMKEVGPQPNPRSDVIQRSHFNLLLNSAKRRRLWKWSLRLVERMQTKGLRPNKGAWRLTLTACAAAGETAAAIHTFDRMVESGHQPGVVEYGLLISALEKGNQVEKAEEVWEHMQKRGVKPNVHAYTTMISALGKRGEYGRAVLLLEEMPSHGCLPTVITYNALITICARTGQGQRALHWLSQMKTNMVEPDSISYQQAIEALINEGTCGNAVDLYFIARARGMKLFSGTRDTLLKVCELNGDIKSMERLRNPQAYSKAKDILLTVV